MKIIQFGEWKCTIRFGKYQNNRIAIELMNAEPIEEYGYVMGTGTERIATATVNVPDFPLKDNEVAIKDYSENDGMLAALIHGNVVHMPHKYVQTGFESCPVCILKVLPNNS